MAITLGLVEAVDDNGVYVSMPGSRGVLRGPYLTLQDVAVGDRVLTVTTDDGESVVVGRAATPEAYEPLNVAEMYGRDDDAVRAAVAEALSSTPARPLYFHQGDFTISGDLTFDERVTLLGDGYGSRLLFTDGGLIFDCTSATVTHTRVRGLRIRRVGTVAGPAVHLNGYGTDGLARFLFDDVHMSSPAGSGGVANAGDACLIEGCYLGTFMFCNFEESQYGIRGILEPTSATGVNAIAFIGGEANGNQYGWDFQRASGITMSGFTTEGNYARGGRIREVSRGFVYTGGYFELNVGPDIEVDCNAGGGAIVIQGNVFYTAGAAKTESILLKRGRVNISDNSFCGLVEADGDVAIRVNETTSPVSGVARNNLHDDDGTLVAYTAGGAAFNVTQLGQTTKAGSTILSSSLNEEAGVSWMRKVSEALNFPSIAANSEESLTVTVTGAVVGDDCSVSSSILEDGLVLKSWGVTAADTVTIRLRNVTGSAIDPSERTYRVRVWR